MTVQPSISKDEMNQMFSEDARPLSLVVTHDRNISLQAKGLFFDLAMASDMTGASRWTMKELRKSGKVKKIAILKAQKQLQDAGYLESHQETTPTGTCTVHKLIGAAWPEII